MDHSKNLTGSIRPVGYDAGQHTEGPPWGAGSVLLLLQTWEAAEHRELEGLHSHSVLPATLDLLPGSGPAGRRARTRAELPARSPSLSALKSSWKKSIKSKLYTKFVFI